MLVAERPLWVWWDSKVPWSNERPDTVLHLRVNKDGTGEGRASIGTDVKRDDTMGIALADTNQPALLTNVKREPI